VEVPDFESYPMHFGGASRSTRTRRRNGGQRDSAAGPLATPTCSPVYCAALSAVPTLLPGEAGGTSARSTGTEAESPRERPRARRDILGRRVLRLIEREILSPEAVAYLTE